MDVVDKLRAVSLIPIEIYLNRLNHARNAHNRCTVEGRTHFKFFNKIKNLVVVF